MIQSLKNFRRFDVILVDFGEDVIGSEQGGIRPAIIVQNDKGNFFGSTAIVMPLTKHIKNLHQPTHALIEKGRGTGLDVNSMAMAECMRQVSEQRFIKYLGKIADDTDKKSIRRVYYASFGE